MDNTIAITAIASISPLGNNQETIWKNYLQEKHFFTKHKFGREQEIFVAKLDENSKDKIAQLRQSDIKYKSLDNSVLYAMAASREVIKMAEWSKETVFGINLGSSRGATQLFEQYYEDFLNTGKVGTLSSPTTTLGNISSWVAHDLQSNGPEISHSITCSTALHALLNGVAWLRAGMLDKFLVGGSEAPVTAFTIAQMQAMKIYSKEEGIFPCRALDLEKEKNTMILGEGAAVACLEIGKKENALAYIIGIGYATELLKHNISISTAADCFQKSMRMALNDTVLQDVDVIVMHAPGTIKGDLSEYNAILKVFGEQIPLLTTNKWKIGHTFGSSGMLSLDMAVMMLQQQQFIESPFVKIKKTDKPINKILVNAVGFGGNAVSVLLARAC